MLSVRSKFMENNADDARNLYCLQYNYQLINSVLFIFSFQIFTFNQ